MSLESLGKVTHRVDLILLGLLMLGCGSVDSPSGRSEPRELIIEETFAGSWPVWVGNHAIAYLRRGAGPFSSVIWSYDLINGASDTLFAIGPGTDLLDTEFGQERLLVYSGGVWMWCSELSTFIGGGLRLIKYDGSTAYSMACETSGSVVASFGPNDNTVAFIRKGEAQPCSLFVYDPETKSSSFVWASDRVDCIPKQIAWLPDGKEVVVVLGYPMGATGNFRINLEQASGVSWLNFPIGSIAIHPNGFTIAYVSSTNPTDVFLFDTRVSIPPYCITDDQSTEVSPHWSPDGRYLSFIRKPNAGSSDGTLIVLDLPNVDS